MSQHSLQIEYQGRPVLVLTGWDRLCKGYFLSVDHVDDDEDDEPVYSSLFDLELLASYGYTTDLAHFADKLAALQIPVPQGVFDELARDRANNTGNRIVQYAADGTVLVEHGC